VTQAPADRARVSHHLIDVAGPFDTFDVSRYAALADAAIAAIAARGRLPIVVGGAGMYIRILLYGLCEAPPQNPDVRRDLMARLQGEGCAPLYEELKKVDPAAALKIHPNDKTRILRALEVFRITGRPLSE
jgi:tRNA dimethylallyltransferase